MFQDNRLEEIPLEVFRLPSLVTLDVSNNKLQELPFQLWKSPKLKELNAAFNLLRELPAPSLEVSPTSDVLHDVDESRALLRCAYIRLIEAITSCIALLLYWEHPELRFYSA